MDKNLAYIHVHMYHQYSTYSTYSNTRASLLIIILLLSY